MAKVRNTCLPFFQGTAPANKVRSILVSYFIHMRLSFNWLFDVKKSEHSSTFSLNLFSQNRFFIYKKIGPINVEPHIYLE